MAQGIPVAILARDSYHCDMFRQYSNSKKKPVCGFIYSLNENGEVYIGLVKKKNINAAGTKPKYWGKMGSIGGTPGKSARHPLDALIREFVDETGAISRGLGKWSYHDCLLANHQTTPSGKILMKILNFEPTRNVNIFIGMMKWDLFNLFFPSSCDYNLSNHIFNDSHRELDWIGRMNTKEIINYQNYILQSYRNNGFLEYFIKSFQEFFVPFMCSINHYYNNKWYGLRINTITDECPLNI